MSPAARRDALAILVLAGATFGALFGLALTSRLRAHPSEDECEALLTRYARLGAKALGDELSPEDRGRAEDTLVPMARSEQNVLRCKNVVSIKAAACAAEAPTADAVEQCLQ